MAEQFENLVDVLEKSAKKYPRNELFGEKRGGQWRFITYADFKREVDRFRGALALVGVITGDKVAIVANNRVEWAVASYATYGLGAAFVPMYEAQVEKEWEFILADCGAKVVIGSTRDIYEKLAKMKPHLPKLEHVIGLDLPESDAHSFPAWLKKG